MKLICPATSRPIVELLNSPKLLLTNSNANPSTFMCEPTRASTAFSNVVYFAEFWRNMNFLESRTLSIHSFINEALHDECDAAVQGPVGPRPDQLDPAVVGESFRKRQLYQLDSRPGESDQWPSTRMTASLYYSMGRHAEPFGPRSLSRIVN